MVILNSQEICTTYEPGAITNIQSLTGDNEEVGEINDQIFSGVTFANSQAQGIVKQVNQMRGPNPLVLAFLGFDSIIDILTVVELSPDDPFVNEYMMGLAPLVGIGAVGLILSCVCCPCFFCARCCCSTRCCKPRKELEEYTITERFRPLITFLVFSLFAAFCALLSITNFGTMIDGIVGMVCETYGLLGNVQIFFGSFIEAITVILPSLLGAFEYLGIVSGNVTTVSTSVGELITEMYDLELSLMTISAQFEETSIEGVDIQLTELVSNLGSHRVNATQSIEEVLGGFSSLSTAAEAFPPELAETFGMAGSLLEGLLTNASAGLFDDLVLQLGFMELVIGGYIGTLQLGSLSFYGTVFLSVAVGLLVAIAYISPCKCDDAIASKLLTLSWCLTYFFMMICFFMFTVYFPLAIVFSDVCGLFLVLPQDFDRTINFFAGLALTGMLGEANSAKMKTAVSAAEVMTLPEMPPMAGIPQPLFHPRSLQTVGNFSIGAVFDGCFAVPSVPIFDSLPFNFSDEAFLFDFSDLQINETISIDFSDIDALVLNLNSFIEDGELAQFNETAKNSALNALNAFSGNTYSIDDCTQTVNCVRACLILEDSSCAPNADYSGGDASGLSDIRIATVDAIIGFELKNLTETYINLLPALFEDKKDEINQSFSNILSALNALITSLGTVNLGSLQGLGDCSFLRDAYYAYHSLLCDNVLGSLLMISVFNLMIGLFAVPTIFSSISVNVRLFGVGQSKSSATVYTE